MGPLEESARDALAARKDACDAGEFETVSLVEIDCTMTVKRLLRDGSPRLQHEIAKLVLNSLPLPQPA